jgi:hypothetical protein
MTPRIFLSRPSLISPEQEMAAGRWSRSLQRMGMEQIAPLPGYVGGTLWATLRRNLEAADGALILGLRQLRIDEGCWRPDTVAPADPAKWWPTPWNHVEAGMAIMAGLPLLAIREDGVAGGIFDSCEWTHGIYGADLDSPATEPSVMAWAGDVFARHGKRIKRGSVANRAS